MVVQLRTHGKLAHTLFMLMKYNVHIIRLARYELHIPKRQIKLFGTARATFAVAIISIILI